MQAERCHYIISDSKCEEPAETHTTQQSKPSHHRKIQSDASLDAQFFPLIEKSLSGRRLSCSPCANNMNISDALNGVFHSDGEEEDEKKLFPSFKYNHSGKNSDLKNGQNGQKKQYAFTCSSPLSNKMTLTKGRGMSLGKIGFSPNSGQNFGFPTKVPEVKPDVMNHANDELIFLENKIQQIKNDSNNRKKCELENNSELLLLTQIEKNLLNDVDEIKKSIENIIKDRAEIQSQHRVWLEDRKRKIVQARKDSTLLQGRENVYQCNNYSSSTSNS
ncbi:hypothetical protein TRFO_15502 [Tritrichomonas foetus]|uniref:Uncharacterized protein n=1 Tax=Tritrichomonas foetus TaxID=1144522 RepID=A0A1J4KSD7_9EUKA|nr:hypothetical protein TRFO_15502 [Tritrichomonas foetus]|eukprot:OHT14209.1 hypothetical protein TRFO_15502 [Tritrichomonas foetus]